MISRIWLANIILAVFTVFFGMKAYGVWSQREQGFSEMHPIKRPLPRPEKEIVKRNIPPESDYEVVVSSNLFRPDRSKLGQGKSESKAESVLKVDYALLKRLEATLRRIIVYGVIISKDYKKALVTNVQSSHNKGSRRQRRQPIIKRTKWIKVGDTLGEFKVNDIREASVLLAAAGNQYQVFLYDEDRPKRRVAVERKESPTVVSLGARIKGSSEVVRTTPEMRVPKPKVSKEKEPPKPRVKIKKSPSKKSQAQ